MISISVKSDVSSFRRQLDSVAHGQLPFALAQALNEVGLPRLADRLGRHPGQLGKFALRHHHRHEIYRRNRLGTKGGDRK